MNWKKRFAAPIAWKCLFYQRKEYHLDAKHENNIMPASYFKLFFHDANMIYTSLIFNSPAPLRFIFPYISNRFQYMKIVDN